MNVAEFGGNEERSKDTTAERIRVQDAVDPIWKHALNGRSCARLVSGQLPLWGERSHFLEAFSVNRPQTRRSCADMSTRREFLSLVVVSRPRTQARCTSNDANPTANRFRDETQ